MRTLVIINPKAGRGKAFEVFEGIKSRIADAFGEITVAATETPAEVGGEIDKAAAGGLDRLIAVGGDGTNHAVINALAERSLPSLSLGSLPAGTGTDWARALGMPGDPVAAAAWLARARPVACDLGRVDYLDTLKGRSPARRYFINIASAGVSGDVDSRVNRARRRSAFTFLRATIATLIKYKPQWVIVDCDDHLFYEGSSYLVVVANGQFFGRGMWVAPKALINDGLFDLILVEGMPRRRILLALQTVFSGKHLERKDVHSARAATVRLRTERSPLSLDFDGEEAQGQDLLFSVLPKAINILVDPSSTRVLAST